MNNPRNWETIKKYEDIFFDYFEGIGKITEKTLFYFLNDCTFNSSLIE
jgi:hypothetical protein